LKNFCYALTLDLQPKSDEKDSTYLAWMVWCFKNSFTI
jgi:hypothetical protein